ncbi:heavy-metal-associated domain-containing protein [Corynebacterium falsenii]|uniref:heavy-metal-associated domain-containing protein n=1 Tax=Corynebacterium falsenii TaxID=108486 RepID=UPI003FD3841D
MSEGTTEQTFTVTGMSCDHCESAVLEEVSRVEGVSNVKVSASEGTLVLDNDGSASEQAILDAVDEAGYEAKPAQ